MIVLRSLLFNVAFFGVAFVLTLAGLVVRLIDQRRIIGLARLWARANLLLLRLICGIRVQVTGLHHLPQGPSLIASRHQSAFDTFVWLTLVPDCCYVLKRELLHIPIFGWLVQAARMIAVDRSGGSAALRQLMRDGQQAAAEGRQIVIFPEGTRSPPGTLLPLQPGVAALAARTRLPVVPVITDSGRSWSRRAFRKRAGVIHIVICPPLPAGLPRDALMSRLQQVLALPVEAAAEAVDNNVGESLPGLRPRPSSSP